MDNAIVSRLTQTFNVRLLDNFPNPILIVRPDTSIAYVNPALERLTGYSFLELAGTKAPYPWYIAENGESLARRTRNFKAVICRNLTAPRTIRNIERSVQSKDGNIFYIEINSRPDVVDNRLRYLVSIWIDITKRKQYEDRLIKMGEELHNLSAHLLSMRERERAQIARQVHDELGQALTALRMDTCWLKKELRKIQLHSGLESMTQLTGVLESMTQLIDDTLQTAKSLSAELRPRMLDEIGLSGTTEYIRREFQEMTGISCKLEAGLDDSALDNDTSTTIFRIIQEALRNIYCHSHAKKVNIELQQRDHQVRLKIHDNGIGITQEQISDPKAFGLIGMRERVRYHKGKVYIRGVKDKGTTLVVSIPLNVKKGADD